MTELDQAWERLLDRLRDTGAIVTGPVGARNERERAEGFRHITRVLSIATEMLVEKGDPAHPAFTRWMTPYRKMYGDNPRTVYDAAVIDGDHAYRIAGKRGTSAYLGFCLYAPDRGGGKRMVGNLEADELALGPDGSFEVLVGGVGLPLDAATSEVMVRQYSVDHETEQPAT